MTSHLGPVHCLGAGIMRQKWPSVAAPDSGNTKGGPETLPIGYCGCGSRGHKLPGGTAVAVRG